MSVGNFLYQNQLIGVRPLSIKEVSGNYPNWFLDMEVCEFNRHGVFGQSEQQVEEFVSRLSRDRSQLVWAVHHIEDEIHVGNISLQNISHIDRSAEIAFLFGEKQYWGKGFASIAARWLIDHGFKRMNLNRIGCGTASTNKPMQKLADRLGMKLEGRRRQALFLNGRYCDILEYGLVKGDWNP